MPSLAPYFNTQFLTLEGVPAAAYLLHTYDAGTTTPKATFTTQAGDVSNANPIVLDADGRCSLWLGSGEYRLRLETPLGALVKTWDDVAGIPDASETSFVPLAGDVTMTGRFNLAGPALSSLQPVTLAQLESEIAEAVAGFVTDAELTALDADLQGQITTNTADIAAAEADIATAEANITSLKGVPANTTAGGVDGEATNVSESFSLDISAWPGGRTRAWQNTTASSLTLTSTGGTLYLNGTNLTGNRTILPRGLVTVRAWTTGVGVISGGVS